MKILVRAPNWVGDAVMAIPALNAIRLARPGAQISILAKRAVADTYRNQSFADRILEYDDHGRHGGFLGRELLASELRRERFDVAMLLQNAFEAAWISWRAHIAQRIGYARNGRSLLLTNPVRVPVEGEVPPHESQYYLELLRRCGWIESRGDGPVARLEVTEPARGAAEVLLREAGSKSGAWRVAIAPGASYGAAKCWAPERFAAVADRLISECGADVILFGTPNETEIAARISSTMKHRAISLVGKTSMRDLGALFSVCSAFIGNDSGAMHVAAAVGLPVIGIFGPTDPAGTAPLTNIVINSNVNHVTDSHTDHFAGHIAGEAAGKFVLIREPVSCSPCFLRKCPIDHRCMTRIEVDSVFFAAQRILSAAGQSFPPSVPPPVSGSTRNA